jgi:hypothetical protein
MDIALVNRGARHSAHLEPWREWLAATNKMPMKKRLLDNQESRIFISRSMAL